MTSAHVVAKVKRALDAAKAGHAGTLDPLATGILPIALGEATKTVPYIVDGEKAYSFMARWGEQRTTDDTEGEVMETSDARPGAEDIAQALSAFTGWIDQVPPIYSAIKVDGRRSYDLARADEAVELAPPAGADQVVHVPRGAGRRPRRLRGGMRQGRLYSQPRARPRAPARHPGTRGFHPPDAGWTVFRGGRDFPG